uniref:UPF3A regulator of nonsense mediated mRNA decay n=1 Tax=Paramormyrops kingsleyae TaxID=1676925 RepID=A0A3B3RNF8_9TELE
MRSEKEAGTAARERRIVEIQFRDLPRDQDSISTNPKQKEEKKEVFTKVVIRRLPPNLSKDQLEEQLSPLPAYDYFEFFSADQSLYPHLYTRAYINFKNPEDIVLFRDRFDGYVFIDNKGNSDLKAFTLLLNIQLNSKRKILTIFKSDPEYRRFLENCCDEEKTTANPETLLGEIEAKTKELIAKRTTPLLEYIKNKKLEKQRIREEKREERRRRELEKKRLREEEKRKRREEERRKRKEVEKQKKLAEKEIKIKLLKKSDRDDDFDSDRLKDKGDNGDPDKSKWDKTPGHMKSKHLDKDLKESDKEQSELKDQGQRSKDLDRHPSRDEERRRQRHHYEFDKFVRRREETKWGKSYCQDRAKKDSQHHGFAYCSDTGDKPVKDEKDDGGSRKERIRNKDRPSMQLYQPGTRTQTGSGGNGYDHGSNSPERGGERRNEIATGADTEKNGDE